MIARYEPPKAILEPASFADASATYRPLPAHVTQPRLLALDDLELPEGSAAGPNPYVDYSRQYTAEGGVALTYKSDDTSSWQIFLRVVAWFLLMAIATGLALQAFASANGCADLSSCAFTPAQGRGGFLAFVLGGSLLAWLLAQPIHAMHSIEIRADCLILEGADVFWTAHMEARPGFITDEAGAYILKGIYGTRHMEFLKLKPVDENDATPAVLANHIEQALKQLWDRPQVWAGG